MRSFLVTNSTLYSLLTTVHANTIPDNQVIYSLLQTIYELEQAIDASQRKAHEEILARLVSVDAKLDQIIAQVVPPPETGALNLATGIITTTKE